MNLTKSYAKNHNKCNKTQTNHKNYRNTLKKCKLNVHNLCHKTREY